MNREIKFRAWDGEKMRTSFVVHNESGYALIEKPCGTEGSWLDIQQDWKVMQFTGLVDKNGNEIYEGDVLLVPYDYTETVNVGVGEVPVAQWAENDVSEVVFEEGAFGFIVHEHTELMKGFYSLTAYIPDYGNDLEVIGNIYENPNLLAQ